MSHGSVNDTILASDGKWFYFQEDIVDKCTSNRTLDGKPKLFVLQACRGNDRIVADARPPRSDKVDVIIFQSTYQGMITKEEHFDFLFNSNSAQDDGMLSLYIPLFILDFCLLKVTYHYVILRRAAFSCNLS